MINAYPCELTTDDDGGTVATFPDVPEAITGGRGRAETLRLAADALSTALAGYVQEKRDIPDPSAGSDGQEIISVPTLVTAKLALYATMRAQHITESELARRLGLSASAARKLADPEHRSRIGQVKEALDAVGCRLAIEFNAA